MIPLPQMSKESEDKYYRAILCILKNIHMFPLLAPSPEDRVEKLNQLFTDLLEISFRDFILAPYEKLKKYKKELAHKYSTYITNAKGQTTKRPYFEAYEYGNETIDFYKLFVEQIFLKFSSNKTYLVKILGQTKLNIWIAKQYDLLICPYCNINYIYSRNNTIFGAQLDHFFSKKNYPIFAICLYNLVPCCSTCNNAKREYESQISPFDDDVDFNKAFQFSFSIENSDFLFSPDSVSIWLKYIGNDGNLLQQDMEQTGIKNAYLPFNTFAQKILQKSYIYNETVIKNLLQQYPDLFKTKNDLLSLIYGSDFWNVYDFNKIYRRQSLSRLEHDLLIEFEVL